MKRFLHAAAAIVAAIGVSAAATPPGTVFRDCPACPEMVVLPAGRFVMGADDIYKAERPAHPVEIARPFAVGRYEVTFDEFQACVDAGGCAKTPYDHEWGQGDRPVINVTFAEAEAYARWLSEHAGHVYRLPSEAEWEYADRAGTTTTFWWGDELGENRANCRGCGSEWDGISTAPVGGFAPNPFGLYDTAGNVIEWTADCWHPDHTGAPADGSVRSDGDCRYRVIRGGNWYYVKKTVRSAWRARNDSRTNSYGIGFRLVRELD